MADGHLASQEASAAKPPCGDVLVAEADGVLAGFIIFGVKQEFGQLVPAERRSVGVVSDLWVEPGARGCGAASALIEAAEARFRAAGLKRAEIGAVAGNADTRRLYGTLGYGPYHVLLAKQL